jgi:hypothetical protein
MNYLLALCALAFSFAATAATSLGPVTDRGFQPMRGTTNVGLPVATEAACWTVLASYAEANRVSLLSAKCRNEKTRVITYSPDPVVCPPAPAPQTRTVQCTAPQVGSWSQTGTSTVGAPPACIITTVWTPATAPVGACTTPPPPAGVAIYFSPAGNNANPGTETAPKRDLAGINVNTLSAGTSLLFQRGGSWAMTTVNVENLNTSAAAPLTFADYGTGALPILTFASGAGFQLGGNFGNTTNDGGYVFRNLLVRGNAADRVFWLVQNVRDVTFDGVQIEGWRIGIASNTEAPFGVTNINVLNSRITNNREMGWLGHVKSGLRMEGNHFEGNNTSGSGLHHAVYNGGGDNGVFRNNRFVRNSIGADGRCSSGGLTLHGLHNNTLIEGNVFEQDAAAPSCWQISINAGYATAEAFRGLVVRGNTVINGGNTGISISAAPGAVVESNRVFRTITVLNSSGTPASTGAISIGPGGSGDDPGGNEVVRGNIACFTIPQPADAVARITTTGATVEGNVLRTGADASSGVCAR